MSGAKPAVAAMVVVLLAACGTDADRPGSVGAEEPLPSVERSIESVASAPSSEPADRFPTERFASLSGEPVSGALADELQAILDASANGHGLTATVITASGTWSGASGMATAERAMVPDDQMSIASITKTIVAAQVMRLVEEGVLRLDDLAANLLPRDLDFDTNEATIANLLSMRSGIPENLQDPEDWESLTTDPLRIWTAEEVLATVAPVRAPAGQAFEYIGNNYLLLKLVAEQVTGRPLAELLRSDVLEGERFARLIYQPDERPTDPVAMPDGAAADSLDEMGGVIPSLAAASALAADGNMASDALTLARWFRGLCAGEIVSAESLEEMTDFDRHPEYGLGLIDRRGEYGPHSGALGHTGGGGPGITTVALCFQDPAAVVVVLANAEHDVDTVAGELVRAAGD